MSATVPGGVGDVVEQVGVWFSSLGVPRAAGQMFGYLLVCDPAEQAASEIAAGIGISRASVSSSARLLMTMNALEERHRVGDRKTYYRLRRDWWIEMADREAQRLRTARRDGQTYQGRRGLRRTDGLDELIEFSDFWTERDPEAGGALVPTTRRTRKRTNDHHRRRSPHQDRGADQALRGREGSGRPGSRGPAR